MCAADRAPPLPRPPPLDLHSIKALSVLGRGAKGVVFLVRAASGPLALKAISRSSIEQKGGGGGAGAYRRIWFERDVLLSLRHPLLPSLHGVVETEEIVGFAIDRCPGGDLSALRRRQTEKMFSDDAIRFYAAELVLALLHLHSLGIVYRDLKPENVLIQGSGHLMLVDFDLSTKLQPTAPTSATAAAISSPLIKKINHNKKQRRRRLRGFFSSCSSGVSPDNDGGAAAAAGAPVEAAKGAAAGKSNSFVGTEEYVAPEVITGSGHDFAVDWWSLGVVLYEMLYGRTPFKGENRKETFYRILTKEPELVGERTPLRDLIGRLLEKDPAKRISGEGVKGHEFFGGVDWEAVVAVARPPFIPAEPEMEDEAEEIDVERLVKDTFEMNCGKGDNEGEEEEAKTKDFSDF